MSETKLILIRHGESLGNASRTLLGHTDLDLSELGYRQAECTAKALQNVKIDCIYSSDLKRAYNTAVPHARLRGMEVKGVKALRELYLGDWEGKSVEEVVVTYGNVYEKEWTERYGTFRMPNGESTQEAGVRFYNECVKIASMHKGGTMLVVAHAAVIRSFCAKVMEISPEEVAQKLPFPSNASYSEVYFDGVGFKIGRFSVDEHLADVGITKFK